MPVTRVLDGVGRYPAESPSSKRPSAVGESSRSMLAVPSGGEVGHVGSLEQALSCS